MRIIASIIFLCLLYSSLKSQQISNQLLSSSGQVSKNKNIQLEWSLGEIATTTITGNNELYSQGFHQPVLIKRTFDNSIETPNSANIEVWPNPTQNYLSVNVKSAEDKNLTFVLFDLNGQRLRNITVEGKEAKFTLNLEKILPGFYYLNIYNSEGIQIDHQKVIKSL